MATLFYYIEFKLGAQENYNDLTDMKYGVFFIYLFHTKTVYNSRCKSYQHRTYINSIVHLYDLYEEQMINEFCRVIWVGRLWYMHDKLYRAPQSHTHH